MVLTFVFDTGIETIFAFAITSKSEMSFKYGKRIR